MATHSFEASQTRATRPGSDAFPEATGYVCAVCGCLEDQCRAQQS